MKFIQDKATDADKFNFIIYTHNNLNGQDASFQATVETTMFNADAPRCRIEYHLKVTDNGATMEDSDVSIDLKAIKAIEVISGDQSAKKAAAAAGQPEIDFRIDPPHFTLTIVKLHETRYYLNFPDESIANRVASALSHAVELCGGGSKEPF